MISSVSRDLISLGLLQVSRVPKVLIYLKVDFNAPVVLKLLSSYCLISARSDLPSVGKKNSYAHAFPVWHVHHCTATSKKLLR